MMIFVEGIDKSGKDTIVRYINEYTNFAHYVSARGPMSVLAYGQKFGRLVDGFSYLENIKDEVLFVYLVVDEDDFNIRCKLTNEPYTNYDEDVNAFDDAHTYITNLGMQTVRLNTSNMTPQRIANVIVQLIHGRNT